MVIVVWGLFVFYDCPAETCFNYNDDHIFHTDCVLLLIHMTAITPTDDLNLFQLLMGHNLAKVYHKHRIYCYC